MELREHLPSGQFATMLAALLISSGLITLAVRSDPQFNHQTASVYASQDAGNDLSATNPDWQQQFAGDTVPEQMATIQNQAAQLSAASAGSNLTQSIGKSLVYQYGALQGQGTLGDASAESDAAAAALAAVNGSQSSAPAYTRADLKLAAGDTQAIHDYANALSGAISSHSAANETVALLLFGTAVDTQDTSSLSQLTASAAQYRALAKAVIATPVPPLFAVYDLQIANNYIQMANAISDMGKVLTDPMRGLLGLQQFSSLATNQAEVFVQIDQLFKSSGIVFASGESGALWDSFATQAKADAAAEAAAIQSASQSATSDTSSNSSDTSLLNMLQSQ